MIEIEAPSGVVRLCAMRLGAMVVALMVGCGSTAPAAPPSAPVSDPLTAPWPNFTPIGAKARAIATKNVAGGAPLAIVPGKVNAIAFWDTWSGPDVYMIEKLEPISKKLGPRGLVILGICLDDEDKNILTTARERGATFAIGWDEGHEAAGRYHPKTDPTIYIVDRTGVIRFVHEGYHDGEDVEIARQIESLL